MSDSGQSPAPGGRRRWAREKEPEVERRVGGATAAEGGAWLGREGARFTPKVGGACGGEAGLEGGEGAGLRAGGRGPGAAGGVARRAGA